MSSQIICILSNQDGSVWPKSGTIQAIDGSGVYTKELDGATDGRRGAGENYLFINASDQGGILRVSPSAAGSGVNFVGLLSDLSTPAEKYLELAPGAKLGVTWDEPGGAWLVYSEFGPITVEA